MTDATVAVTGVLYVVATPIGNLSDITLRAIEVLREVPLIAAEDTRITRRLLARHAIATRLVSFHARSAPTRSVELLEHLRGGASLAIVTDAGTPVVSDPGGPFIGAWAGEGGRVVPIPGASSVLAAISATGIAGPRWTFEGFLPRTGRDRRRRLESIASDDRGCVVFEAPTRAAATLRDLAAAGGVDRPAAVCRELTKLHEQIVVANLGDLETALADGSIPARGEFVIVVGMAAAGLTGVGADRASAAEGRQHAEDLVLARATVDRLVRDGSARGDAARRVAGETGIPRRQLYGGVDEGGDPAEASEKG